MSARGIRIRAISARILTEQTVADRVTSRRANVCGTDRAGNTWYANLADGRKVWVRVRGDKNLNGGSTRTPATSREPDEEEPLSRNRRFEPCSSLDAYHERNLGKSRIRRRLR